MHSCRFSLFFYQFSTKCCELDTTVNSCRVSKCAPVALKTLKYLSSFCCRSRAVTLYWESGNFTWRGFLWLFCGMSLSCVDISVFRMERQYRSRVEAKTRLSSVSFLIQVFGLKGAQVTKSMNCMLIKVLLSMKRMPFLYFGDNLTILHTRL